LPPWHLSAIAAASFAGNRGWTADDLQKLIYMADHVDDFARVVEFDFTVCRRVAPQAKCAAPIWRPRKDLAEAAAGDG
jgi:hypothetical protein